VSVRRSMAWSLTGSVGFFVIQFVTSVIVARLLTPAEMGVYAVSLSALMLLTSFQNLGFQSFIVREAELDRATLGTVLTMATTQGAALAALLWLGAPLLAGFLDEPRVTPALRILCLFAALSPIETIASGLLQRRMRFDLLTLMGLIRVLSAGGLAVGLAYAGYSYASLSWGASGAQAITTVVAFALTGSQLWGRPTLSRWRGVWAYGANILATMSVANIFARLPDLVLGKLAGIATVGLYGRASGIVDAFTTGVLYGVNKVTLKALVDARDAQGRIDHVYLRTLRAATGLFWPMFAGLAVLSGPVITLIYGERWAPAAPVLAFLCAAAIIQVSVLSRQEVLIATGRERELPKLETIRGAAGLALFTIGASYGLVPAAASRVGEALVQHGAYVGRIRAAADLRFADIYRCYAASATVTLAAVAPAVALMAWRGWSDEVPFAEVLGATAAGALCWLAALFATGHELRGEVAKVWRGLAARASVGRS
jgi:O-antigen/teichoic acid export membrane protein